MKLIAKFQKTDPWKRAAACLLAAGLCFACGIAVLAAGNEKKTAATESETAATIRLSRTEGSVKVSGAAGKEVTQIKNMSLTDGYSIATQKKSYAWTELDKTKLIKVDAVSDVEIRKSGKLLEMLVTSGNMFFNITEPLSGDETLNICTSSMIAGVRGTCGWIRIIDKKRVRIYILEGSLECTIIDPVTGEEKSEYVNGGEWADFVVYDLDGTEQLEADEDLDGCMIERGGFTKADVPGFVLIELAGDEKRCEEIFQDSGIDLRNVTPEEALERLKEDEDALETLLELIEDALANQDSNISTDLVWEEEKPVIRTAAARTPSPSPEPAAPSAGTEETPAPTETPAPNPVQSVNIKESSDSVEEMLKNGNDVTVKGDETSNIYQISGDLNIPAGTTLSVEEGLTLAVDDGATVSVDGTLMANGDMDNSGTVIVNSGESVHVAGSLANTGTIINQNSGLIDAADGIDNYGSIKCDGSSTLKSSSPDGTVRMRGSDSSLMVSGGNITNEGSGAALALEDAGQVERLTFTSETLLQSLSENVLTVGGQTLRIDNYDVSYDGTRYFQFKIETRTVTFDGGVESTVKTVKVIVGYPVGSGMPALTRPGYDLDGWNKAPDGSGGEFTKDTAVTEDLTVYAVWRENPLRYTVTFDAGSGKLTGESSVEVPHNGTVTLPTPIAPSGYAFFGWYTAPDSAGKKVTGSEPVTSDVTYYARWIPSDATVTVTYDRNDGSDTAVTTETIALGSALEKPGDPEREGHEFGGWYTDADCTYAYKFGEAVTEDITLYAKWEASIYTISFNANGGSLAEGTPETVLIAHGDKLEKPADPARTGYTFAEWFTDEACTKAYDFTAPVKGDVTLYAKWTLLSYSVIFHSKGGTEVPVQTIGYGKNAEKPENPTRTGYTFSGWYTDEECTKEYNFETPVTANTTLYAKWTPVKCTVEFDTGESGDVTDKPADQTVDYNTAAKEPAKAPARTGYDFDGWFVDEACTKAYDFETPVTADIKIYAKWTKLYKVTFMLDHGTAEGYETDASGDTMVVQTVRDGEKATVPTDLARTETYTPASGGTAYDIESVFYQWYTDESLDADKVFPADSTVVTDDLTLYAGWERIMGNSENSMIAYFGGSYGKKAGEEYSVSLDDPLRPEVSSSVPLRIRNADSVEKLDVDLKINAAETAADITLAGLIINYSRPDDIPFVVRGDQGITIRLEDKSYNEINGNNGSGIYNTGSGTLVITGTGSLALNGGWQRDGLCSKGDVVIESGNLTCSADGSTDNCGGIYSEGNITIQGGTVSATGHDIGIKANNAVTISGGSVTAVSDTGMGICGSGSVEIKGNTELVDATGATSGIYGGTVKISAGKLIKAKKTQGGYDFGGIEAGESMEITGGVVKADGIVNAIRVDGRIEIGGTADVTTTNESGDGNGIKARVFVTINGGTVNVACTNGYGILAEESRVEILKGTVNAKVTVTPEQTNPETLYAICSNGSDVVVSGGSVTAESAKGAAISGQKFKISDGSVTAVGGTKGIHGEVSVEISGGDVTATGEDESGIEAGGVSITGGVVRATGGRNGVSAVYPDSIVEIKDAFLYTEGSNCSTYSESPITIENSTVIAKSGTELFFASIHNYEEIKNSVVSRNGDVTVYGTSMLRDSLEIAAGKSLSFNVNLVEPVDAPKNLTIPSGVMVTHSGNEIRVGADETITVNSGGSFINKSRIDLYGRIVNAGLFDNSAGTILGPEDNITDTGEFINKITMPR